MEKKFKISVPYLGKVAVVTVVSFSCAISAYQLYQNNSIFSPQSQSLDLKNNQVVFSNQNKETNSKQNQDESQFLKENQQSFDKISQTNFNSSPYLFKNQGNIDTSRIYGQTGLGINGTNTISVDPNGTGSSDGNVVIVIPGEDIPISSNGSGISDEDVNKDTNQGNTTIHDPDPEPIPPDLSKDPVYADAITFPSTGIIQKDNATYTIRFLDPDIISDSGNSMLYYGCVITPWKLLCNMVVMISEKKEGEEYPTLYRVEDYNDNFKIGSYPQYATEDFKVKFYFRLNESSPWQEYIYEFKVNYQSRISLLGLDHEEVKFLYLKKDETEDLRKYYNLVLPTYQNLTGMFVGWKNEDGSIIKDQTAYSTSQKGRVTLVPQETVAVPEGYEIQLQSQYVFDPSFYLIYEYVFTGYSGDEFVDIHIPNEVNKIDIYDSFGQIYNGDFYIPETVDGISLGWSGLMLYGKYIVDEDNPYYSSNEDGLLFNKDQSKLYQTPMVDIVYIPKGVVAINDSLMWSISDIYFEEDCMLDSVSFGNLPTTANIHVPDQYYLNYFKKWYGNYGLLLNEDGESRNYVVNNGLILSEDEKVLVSTLDSTNGTMVIPDTIKKIDDYAFSGENNITCIILTHGDMELGHQIFKDSKVENIMVLSQDIPSIYEDTFDNAPFLNTINIAKDYYSLYKSKWNDVLNQQVLSLLDETDSMLQTKNGFEYLEMYYKDQSHATILLNAPVDLIEFDEKSIPNVTITEIGKNAFSECKSLKRVKLSKDVDQIDSYAFYGCDALEGIFSANTESITIQENGLEITDSWLSTIRYIAFNAKQAHFENFYLPSNNQSIYVPYDGEGYNGGNTYSSEYFLDESYGGAILYGYGRGYNDNDEPVTIYNEFYLIKATTDVIGDVETKEGTFEICTNAFDSVPITSIQLNMTDYIYWIDDGAFWGSSLSGELDLPDGLGPIGYSAFYGTNLSKVVFPKRYTADTDYPARLQSDTFAYSSNLSEIVFQSAEPIELNFYSEGNGFEFGMDLADDFHITLIEDAAGLEETYIDVWKYSFAGYDIFNSFGHEENVEAAALKVAELLNYTYPTSIDEVDSQSNDNYELNGTVEKNLDIEEIEDVSNEKEETTIQQHDDNQQIALENEGEENDN